MKKIINSILRHNLIILIISILLIAGGIYSYIQIPKEEMPEVETLYGYIQVTAPGLSNQEVLDKISNPIEDIINNYSNVENYTTTSVDNACVIVIEMEISDKKSEETLEKIKSDVLNAWIDESITDMTFITDLKTSEAIYAVYSDELSELELESIANDLSSEINLLDNVAKTKVDSTFSQEIVVEIDYEKINDLPITISDVNNVILANGMEIPLGTTELNGKTSSIILDSYYTTIEEIRDLVVYMTADRSYKVEDIANVTKLNTQDKKVYEFNGKTAVFVEVFFDNDIDFTVLGDELSDTVDEFKKNTDENVSIDAMTFSPKYVKDQVNSVMKNLLLCIAIVMFVVLIGLGVRNSMVIAITIPVIVFSTIGVLYIMGEHLQLMSIAGLIVSIGILVDNSIVISEATQHALDRGKDIRKASIKAIKNNYLPVLTSTLTTVAAFIPLMYLPGTAGDVAFTLPLTVLLAITISYLVAVTLTPTLAKFFFRPRKVKRKRNKKNVKAIKGIMESVFKMGLFPTILAFILLIVTGYYAYDKLDIEIMPKTEKSIVYIDYEYEVFNDNEGTYNFAKEIEEVVKNQPDVINYAFSQGGDLPKFYMTLGVVSSLPHNGRFFIEYNCDSMDLDDYMYKLESDLQPLEEQGIIDVRRLELSQAGSPVQIVLTSYDYDNLIAVAKEIFAETEKLESFRSGELVAPDEKTDIFFDIDKDEINKNYLTVSEVEQQIALNVNGLSESLYEIDDNMLDVSVRTNIDSREDLLNLKIKSSYNTSVPLGDIATIEQVQNLDYISLYNGVPSVTIDANMAEGYSTFDLEKDIKEIIEDKTDNTISVYYKGDNELTNEIFEGILMAFVVAIFFIYLIMYFQFKSLKQPFIILVTIPLSFIGSFVTLLALGEKITLTSLLGVVSLVGIVVNNGILLVEYINHHHAQGNSIFDSCVMAVSRRLRPIALTSLTTILGLIPLAFWGGDFFRPMAVTFMGGMLTSTLFVLVVIPGLYYFTYKKKDKKIEQKKELNDKAL